MKKLKKFLFAAFTVAILSCLLCQPAFAAISESDVQAQVDAVGKEAVSGNVFIWFLCAIGFLKVGQKIDSFLSSLGVNVGHTGGSMLAEAMIAARGIGGIKNFSSHHFGGGRNSSSTNVNANGGKGSGGFGAGFASGGLAGVVSRKVTNSAIKTATTTPSSKPSGLGSLLGDAAAGGIGGHMYASSVSKGGNFANNVIGSVATGSISQMGSISGEKAAEALHSYMGYAALESGAENVPTFQNVEIGGGRITGTEVTAEHPEGISFGMYHADQYVAPEGQYTTVHAVDGTAWYKQYAVDAVDKSPYMAPDGSIAFNESIVKKLPPAPRRKDKIYMPEDQKSGFSEAVETGASAAHTIRGAIKTGKAISSAAKGAAAGGPYGAVAGAVWAGRKHIGKIIVAVIALLMLPVLFVLMLPGLIFGGLTNAFSPSDPEIPILNSETAIIENANEITFTLNGILGEALDDVLARIEADFAASGADHMEVKNAYSGGPIYNANLFISQYCAAKDKDFESISLNDLAATLRENKQHLYSYTSKQEIRESTVTDPETGEETTEPETWMVYTVRYNGESYFSDVVFQLTDDQKELAADYASNLSLFLGDGLLQNLEAWTGNSITSLGDVTFTDGITPVVYYNQLDERYAGKAYGTDNIGGYGCGPTAMAIVVSSLTDDMVDPVEMAEWSYNNGYWCKSSGSYHALIPAAAGEWGLPVSGCTTAEPQRITDALANGKLVVAIMSEGHFTSSGHFIVLRGVKDGKIMVADPASYTRSEQLWDLSIILNEASRRAGAGGPFWIIG